MQQNELKFLGINCWHWSPNLTRIWTVICAETSGKQKLFCNTIWTDIGRKFSAIHCADLRSREFRIGIEIQLLPDMRNAPKQAKFERKLKCQATKKIATIKTILKFLKSAELATVIHTATNCRTTETSQQSQTEIKYLKTTKTATVIDCIRVVKSQQ